MKMTPEQKIEARNALMLLWELLREPDESIAIHKAEHLVNYIDEMGDSDD